MNNSFVTLYTTLCTTYSWVKNCYEPQINGSKMVTILILTQSYQLLVWVLKERSLLPNIWPWVVTLLKTFSRVRVTCQKTQKWTVQSNSLCTAFTTKFLSISSSRDCILMFLCILWAILCVITNMLLPFAHMERWLYIRRDPTSYPPIFFSLKGNRIYFFFVMPVLFLTFEDINRYLSTAVEKCFL